MTNTSQPLELLWDKLLSSEPELIREAFTSLDPGSRRTVISHLQNMVEQAGWQPEQRSSAGAALLALKEFSDQD
jgi:hypothetical protein